MHLCRPKLIIATRFCMESQNMPSKSCNVCKTWLPVSSHVHEIIERNAGPEETANWLPVKYRIIFKVVLLTFKARHGVAPKVP